MGSMEDRDIASAIASTTRRWGRPPRTAASGGSAPIRRGSAPPAGASSLYKSSLWLDGVRAPVENSPLRRLKSDSPGARWRDLGPRHDACGRPARNTASQRMV